MSTVTRQPTGQGAFEYTGDWSTGICECCADLKSCIFAVLCFHCYLCLLHKEAGECCLTPVFCPGSLIQLRSKLRAHYKIEGSLWKDALITQCLPFCAALQLSNELRAHGDTQF